MHDAPEIDSVECYAQNLAYGLIDSNCKYRSQSLRVDFGYISSTSLTKNELAIPLGSTFIFIKGTGWWVQIQLIVLRDADPDAFDGL